jgi:hypothetical protein
LASSGIKPPKLSLGVFVLKKSLPCAAKHAGKLSPGIGRTHVDDANGLNARTRWLDAKQPWRLPVLDAAPELLFGGQEQVLVERIGPNGDLDPFAAPRDDRERGRLGVGHPHVVLALGHMFLGRRLFGK